MSKRERKVPQRFVAVGRTKKQKHTYAHIPTHDDAEVEDWSAIDAPEPDPGHAAAFDQFIAQSGHASAFDEFIDSEKTNQRAGMFKHYLSFVKSQRLVFRDTERKVRDSVRSTIATYDDTNDPEEKKVVRLLISAKDRELKFVQQLETRYKLVRDEIVKLRDA